MTARPDLDAMPVVSSLGDFDHRSGMLLERSIFNHRRVVMGLVAAASAVLAIFAVTKSVLNADFERMIPTHHPYIRNYLASTAPGCDRSGPPACAGTRSPRRVSAVAR